MGQNKLKLNVSTVFWVCFPPSTQRPVSDSGFLLVLTCRHRLSSPSVKHIWIFTRVSQERHRRAFICAMGPAGGAEDHRYLLWGHGGCWHCSCAPVICAQEKKERRVKWGWHISLQENPQRGRLFPWRSLAPCMPGPVWRPPETNRLKRGKHTYNLRHHPDTNTLWKRNLFEMWGGQRWMSVERRRIWRKTRERRSKEFVRL